MKVIVIFEEGFGKIGIAADYYSAIHFLIQHSWLTDDYKIWNENSEEWDLLINILGAKWNEKLFSWDIDDFNDFFTDRFLLTVEEVIRYK